MVAMKTPGVYIVEKDAFPNSVVEIATAVPAFVGYTQFAKKGQKDIFNQPVRILSMAEYEIFFGGKYQDTFILEESEAGSATASTTATASKTATLAADEKAAEKKRLEAEKKKLEAGGEDLLNISGKMFLLKRSKFSPKYLMYRSMQLFLKTAAGYVTSYLWVLINRAMMP